MEPQKIKTLPIIPIRDGVIFPGTEAILTFGRKRSLTAIESAFKSNKLAVFVMQINSSINEPTPQDVFKIGTLAKIDRMLKSDNDINALVKGIFRVEIVSYEAFEPFFIGKILEIPDQEKTSDDITALCNHLTSQVRKAVNLGKNVDFLVFMNIMSGLSPAVLSNHIASILNIKSIEKQQLLEEQDLKQRLDRINQYLSHELKVLEIERNIASKTQAKFDKNVREVVLRERLKTIEKELGQSSESREIKEIAVKIKKANMPQDVRQKIEKELNRFAQMSNLNPEASYLRTYLEWITDLPWSKQSLNNVDIKNAQKILDEDHYGLQTIKERIIEYLAVMKLKSGKQAKQLKSQDKEKGVRKGAISPTILCFVGPPGIGKTSIGRSIARALKRKFVKISLGGIRDEAEIRGHRRTYVGALPGRIIQGTKQAGTNNPVFMLDEIDKVGVDFRGDPSAALLEALDPEQNYAFSDHYLEVPFDLSNVMFITTCNVLDTIPPALKDRLEVIRFAGYTHEEKFYIAKDFLIKKQLQVHGLDERIVTITPAAINTITTYYTREAGVRELERQIAKIFRKVARQIAEGKHKKFIIGVNQLSVYLGPKKYTSFLAEKKDEIGMSTGLFWTQAGGGILFIEVALMPGKGSLLLTGHLGDVMKESCQAALSYVRSRAKEFGLNEKFYKDIDIHVHVPEGAVPKDGPSAGIAIVMALVSALTKTPIKRDIGMTGEITLRGRVLEISGVKEKVIAAHQAGLKTVIMPAENKKHLDEIPKKIRDTLKIIFVKHVDEVFRTALTKKFQKDGEVGIKSPLIQRKPLFSINA